MVDERIDWVSIPLRDCLNLNDFCNVTLEWPKASGSCMCVNCACLEREQHQQSAGGRDGVHCTILVYQRSVHIMSLEGNGSL